MDSPSFPQAQAIIPGGYELTTWKPRQPGAMGGSGFGSAGIRPGASLLDAATIAAHEKEGGGGVSQRPTITYQPQTGRTAADGSHNASRPVQGHAWFQFWRFLSR